MASAAAAPGVARADELREKKKSKDVVAKVIERLTSFVLLVARILIILSP